MDAQQHFALFEEALELPAGTLSRDTVIADVEQWDSLGWLTIMSVVDERLGAQLDAKQLRRVQTVGDLVDYINSLG